MSPSMVGDLSAECCASGRRSRASCPVRPRQPRRRSLARSPQSHLRPASSSGWAIAPRSSACTFLPPSARAAAGVREPLEPGHGRTAVAHQQPRVYTGSPAVLPRNRSPLRNHAQHAWSSANVRAAGVGDEGDGAAARVTRLRSAAYRKPGQGGGLRRSSAGDVCQALRGRGDELLDVLVNASQEGQRGVASGVLPQTIDIGPIELVRVFVLALRCSLSWE